MIKKDCDRLDRSLRVFCQYHQAHADTKTSLEICSAICLSEGLIWHVVYGVVYKQDIE